MHILAKLYLYVAILTYLCSINLASITHMNTFKQQVNHFYIGKTHNFIRMQY